MLEINILLADDDYVFLQLTSAFLKKNGYAVDCAPDIETTEALLQKNDYDIMMLDMCFPALYDGFDLLSKVHENYPDLPVLMISGSGHIPDAVKAIQKGAEDFIEKPIDTTHLLLRLERIYDSLVMKKQMHSLYLAAIGMQGKSAAMQTLYDNICKAAKFDCSVLITGETGVGKELAAHAIHRLSKYSEKNMVSINCASIPKELFEAELFGYESGAFTGAIKAHRGYFEFADDNSIFMDEISQLPLEVQAKLLRVVSENEIQKIGGKVQKINTRIISATNQDLQQLVENNLFRKDLLYRLNTIEINIPPLRNRIEDIPVLAEYFMSEFCSRNDLQPKPISPSAVSWLCEQKWEGNVRELKNALERAVVFAKNDHLTVVDFTTPSDSNLDEREFGSLRKAITSFERAYIENVLRVYNYNMRQAAHHLQMDNSNLFKKIAALKISLPGH